MLDSQKAAHMQSLAARYVEVVRNTFRSSDRWTWPSDRQAGESSPDTRLMNYNLANTVANVATPDGKTVRCSLRAVTHNDLVLTCEDETLVPLLGQAVEISVITEGKEIATATTILHWCGEIYGDLVIAGFTVDTIPEGLTHKSDDCSRGQLRFPLDIPAVVSVGPEKDVFGRIMDYSLSGCRFLSEEVIDLDTDYPMTALMPSSAVELTLHPRWVLNTMNGYQLGCSLESEQGVLLACRHHPSPTGFSFPLKPVTQQWDPSEENHDQY